MAPHEQRVVDEKRELDEKLEKLTAFVRSSPNFKRLDGFDRSLLTQQRDAMLRYSVILGERIARFPAAT
jgi:hypothetical protein